MIGIIDYGAGNINSVIRMVEHIGGMAVRISSPDQVDTKVKKLILPGVGAFDNAINRLEEGKWISAISNAVLINRIPILGICLGMQLFCKSSDEGNTKGLGWIDATVHRFPESLIFKVPHMGWNTLALRNSGSIIDESEEKSRFYFVHSYYVRCNNLNDILATSSHGVDFVAAFNKDNIYGVQFHPEKSHRYGMALIAKFINI
jgi:glutamine amidotransferase